MPLFRNLKNKKFGRLFVTKRAHNSKYGEAMWYTICKCGNRKIVLSSSLTKGDTKSCGCFQKESLKNRKINVRPDAAFRLIFRTYKDNAGVFKRPFSLNETQFKELTSSKCFYCGVSPKNKSEAYSGEVYFWNGVDRKNPDLGYTIHNCVACCTACNFMKRDTPYKAFILKCKIIVSLRGHNV